MGERSLVVRARSLPVLRAHTANATADAETPAVPVWLALLLLFWRRRRFLIGCMALFAIGSAIGAFLKPDMYRAVATIEVQPRNQDFLNAREIYQTSPTGMDNTETLLRVRMAELTDIGMADRVTSVLKLDKDPNFKLDPVVYWTARLREFVKRGSETSGDRALMVTKTVMGRLDVRRIQPGHLIAISVKDPDAARATAIANTYALEFRSKTGQMRTEELRNTRDFLVAEVAKAQGHLRDLEQKLNDYAAEHGIASGGADGPAQELHLKAIRELQANALTDRVAKQSLYETAKNAPLETVAAIANDNSLQGFIVRLTELETQAADLTSKFGRDHPQVQSIRKQIDSVRAQIEVKRRDVLQSMRNDYEAAVEREHLMNKAAEEQTDLVTHLGTRTVDYTVLQSQVDAQRSLYNSLVQKANDASVSAAAVVSEVLIVGPADEPSKTEGGNPVKSAAFGGAAGLALATLLILLHASLDRTIRSVHHTATLAVPVLAAIPKFTAPLNLGDRDRNFAWLPENAEADAIRDAATSITLTLDPEGEHRVVAVTSPQPGEGKTTIVASLGAALAESNLKTIIVDADFRRPSLHKVFDVENVRGLSNFLSGKMNADDHAIWEFINETPVPGLYLIVSGDVRGNPIRLLSATRWKSLVTALRHEFDVVLIDCPPLLTPDARKTAITAGSAIIVCREAETLRHEAYEACKGLMRDGVDVLGTILNASVEARSRYDRYRSEDRASSA